MVIGVQAAVDAAFEREERIAQSLRENKVLEKASDNWDNAELLLAEGKAKRACQMLDNLASSLAAIGFIPADLGFTDVQNQWDALRIQSYLLRAKDLDDSKKPSLSVLRCAFRHMEAAGCLDDPMAFIGEYGVPTVMKNTHRAYIRFESKLNRQTLLPEIEGASY